MSTGEVDCITRFERSHDVHVFRAMDGMEITGISVPSWEEFEATLADLPLTDGYITSPELITSPVTLDEIPGMRSVIEERTEWVREESRRHPMARILLGTATFGPGGQMPRNSVVAFVDGQEVGRQHKIQGSWGENKFFQSSGDSEENGVAVDITGHRLLICFDLIEAANSASATTRPLSEGVRARANRIIPSSARTIIAVSCWGVPPLDGLNQDQTETICASALNRSAHGVFLHFPRLEEIIIVDRAIPEVGTRPFNAHIKRIH